ncbi:hypothetical protein [Aquifex sp.]
MRILILLLLVSLSFSKTITYGVKVLWFEVGEIKVILTQDKAVAEGKTYKSFEWLYRYNFKFVWKRNKIYLYEREKDKERVYEGNQVYEKKPWIPIVVEYLRSGKVKESKLFSVKREGNKIIVIPKKSKKVKKIVLYGGKIPKKIKIYGKLTITLILKDVREDKGSLQERRLRTFGRAGQKV